MSRSYEIEATESDRRDSFRMPALHERSEGRIRVGRQWIPCDVIDESTGGFMISIDKLPRSSFDGPLWLQTTNDTVQVLIAWRRKEGKETRVGLRRLPDDFQTRGRSERWFWFTAALVVGFGLGYVHAYRGLPFNYPLRQTIAPLNIANRQETTGTHTHEISADRELSPNESVPDSAH